MIKYYRNCLEYFKIKDPFEYKYNDDNTKAIGNSILLTTTPYIFITQQVKNMINHAVVLFGIQSSVGKLLGNIDF